MIPKIHSHIVPGPLIFMAVHAGSIEPYTDVVAQKLAARFGSSHWSYQYDGQEPKIGSCSMFMNKDPFGLRAILSQHELIVSIHGHNQSDDYIYVGGAHSIGAFYIRQELLLRKLRAPVPPTALAGNSRYNICNRAGPCATSEPFVTVPNSSRRVRVGLPFIAPPHIGPGIQIELPSSKLNNMSIHGLFWDSVYASVAKGVEHTLNWMKDHKR